MRILLSGASGFVGSNIAKVLEDLHGDDALTERIDLFDRAAIDHHIETTRPDGVIHVRS